MTHFNSTIVSLPVKGMLIGLVLLAYGCGQAPSEAGSDEAQQPAVAAEPHANEHGVKSIDADGNIAPFGMASRQPVKVADSAVPSAGAEAVAASSALYSTHCMACHGADAQGVEGLGLNLVESQLVAASSRAELIAFLKEGRAADSPQSVTNVPMPSFVWMSDGDLAEIAGYIKSL